MCFQGMNCDHSKCRGEESNYTFWSIWPVTLAGTWIKPICINSLCFHKLIPCLKKAQSKGIDNNIHVSISVIRRIRKCTERG